MCGLTNYSFEKKRYGLANDSLEKTPAPRIRCRLQARSLKEAEKRLCKFRRSLGGHDRVHVRREASYAARDHSDASIQHRGHEASANNEPTARVLVRAGSTAKIE